MNQEATIKRIDQKLTTLLQKTGSDEKPKQVWVSAYWMKQLTVFDTDDRLLIARKSGLIEFKKSGIKKVEYLISEVNDVFLKPKK